MVEAVEQLIRGPLLQPTGAAKPFNGFLARTEPLSQSEHLLF